MVKQFELKKKAQYKIKCLPIPKCFYYAEANEVCAKVKQTSEEKTSTTHLLHLSKMFK